MFCVLGNELYDNYDAGLSLVETMRTKVTGNKIENNKWGVRLLLGASDNEVPPGNVFFQETLSCNETAYPLILGSAHVSVAPGWLVSFSPIGASAVGWSFLILLLSLCAHVCL